MVQKGDRFPLNWDVLGQTGMYSKSMNKVIDYLVLDCLKM